MRRARAAFLVTSIVVVLLFAGALTASRVGREDLFQALGNLAEVVHLVRTEYVDELNPDALALSLDAGLVESIDRSAAVLPGDQVERYLKLLEAPPPFGVGLASRLGSAAVRHTVAGSPAETAGLAVGELIELIDGVNTRGRPLWQIRLELWQAEQDKRAVKLSVVDRRVDERREVILEPASWDGRVIDVREVDGCSVVTLGTLARGTAAAVATKIGGGSQVVLDVREVVWGFAEEAVSLADLFAKQGVLAQWRGRRAGEGVFEATDSGDELSSGLFVLIGGNTEGPGEVLAAALQRNGATLVGQRTVGYAPSMRMVNDGDLYLWMPVASWLRGDGEPISGKGIEPDEKVEGLAEGEVDPVLERALELIHSTAVKEAA
jgi:C-terminal processing protease CtpA/Prc